MGELFRWEQPEEGLAWTGERFVNGIGGDGRIEVEHLHRYFIAREFCRGRSVLDVASGEGYGSSLLAQTATNVLGVDLDIGSVMHASKNYGSSNLNFAQASATALPVESNSMEVVVSFETLEHFVDHEQFLREIRRVLKTDGCLIISTPDVDVYSGGNSTANPYHMRELTEAEFVSELSAEFSRVILMRQRVVTGSAVLPDAGLSSFGPPLVFERRNATTFEAAKRLQRAPYLLALASNSEIQAMTGSVYVYADQLSPPPVAQDVQQRESEHVRKEIELMQERMLASSFVSGQQDLVARRLQRDLVQRTMSGLELEKLQSQLAAAHSELAAIRSRLTAALAETDAVRSEWEAARAASDADRARSDADRAQSDAIHAELTAALAHLTISREELAMTHSSLEARAIELSNLSKSYNEVCRLIIPIRMRRILPAWSKSPLRAIKRALKNG